MTRATLEHEEVAQALLSGPTGRQWRPLEKPTASGKRTLTWYWKLHRIQKAACTFTSKDLKNAMAGMILDVVGKLATSFASLEPCRKSISVHSKRVCINATGGLFVESIIQRISSVVFNATGK